MSLVPCRACGHKVDTSALTCPECGATDPGHKISRQQRNAIGFFVQLAVILALLSWGSWYVWNTVIPKARELITKPAQEAPAASRQSAQ
ncbi:zinc ribbon domain-containing protein [Propionivibrio limicola]|uniref:zinc ribbon domain-containing protein n=1 Tax=Propionivibrio limicola TaxID=167645 RepID=UPI001291186C|nr:hypothetical protein [Propionivibrio limicola]